MKTLYLVRHAKSSRDDPTLSDRDRPLNERGLDDASAMGKRLAKHKVKPDLMVSSPALRALTTAQRIAGEIGYPRKHVLVDDQLYAARVDDLLAVVRDTDEKIDRLMLFGHNPEFSGLASRLAGQSVDMSTCAVAEFDYDSRSWSDVGVAEPARFALEQPKR
jgi:phosphohistidine phosphatase